MYDDKNFLIMYKDSGIPSSPLKSIEEEKNNALAFAIENFPQIKNVKNQLKPIEYGLVHRIDTETEGVLLIAKNTETWNFFRKIQSENQFTKQYFAICNKKIASQEGFPNCPFYLRNGQIITSKFRHYGKGRSQVRPVLQDCKATFASKKASDKIYSTKILDYEVIPGNKNCNFFKIKCSITQGFRHQVRCHLAWLGYPVVNDKLYNTENDFSQKFDTQMQFFATGLEFPSLEDKSKIFRFDASNKIK